MSIEDDQRPLQEPQAIAPDQTIADAWRESRLDVGSQVIGYYDPPQDALLADASKGLFGAFDGLGGSDVGDEASGCAAQTIRDYYEDLSEAADVAAAGEDLRDAVVAAHFAIREQIESEDTPVTAETTACVMKLWESDSHDKHALIAGPGDSRAYRLTARGEFRQITVDNVDAQTSESAVQRLRSEQEAQSEIADNAEVHKQDYLEIRHNVQHVLGGTETPNVRVYDEPIEAGDKVALMTDGVHDNLTASEIRSIMEQATTGQEISTLLARAAYERSQDSSHVRAKPDDIGVVGIVVS